MKFASRFQPAIFKFWRGYTGADFYQDFGAGTTVGLLALPLAIGFGIASGVTPAQGLWTAIVAGFLISAFGGSKFQVGGPTGAFVPVLAAIVAAHGYEGLALATMMAGAMLVLMGFFRMGTLLRFIPYPVVAGFTSGIAIIIFTAQLNDAMGLGIRMPHHIPQQLLALATHLGCVQWQALAVAAATFAIIHGWPRVTRAVPAAIVAVVLTSLLAIWLGWPVETIGTKFGGIPAGLPGWHFPEISLDRLRDLLGAAATIAALGAIESLLSAAVADGMTDTRHDSNQELIGQGLANLLTPLIGGIAATGAIARTAASIRHGARSPVAGIVHAAVLLGIVLIAAPLAKYIPLATLSAILIVVALRMAEWHTFVELWHGPRTDFVVMLSTFALTIIFDLTAGVGCGMVLAVILFIRRMEEMTHVKILTPESDTEMEGNLSVRGKTVPDGVVLFRIHGPLFFAAADKLEAALKGSGGRPQVVIFRMRMVPLMDASGLHAFEVAVEKMQRDGVVVLLTAVQAQPMKAMHESGLSHRIGLDNFCASIDQALARARQLLTQP
jgi:SulP family sulfate permease